MFDYNPPLASLLAGQQTPPTPQGCSPSLQREPCLARDLSGQQFGQVLPADLTAVKSTIAELRSAKLQVIRTIPDDLVSAAKIARRTNRARESTRLLETGELVSDRKAWRWHAVIQWMQKHQIGDDPETASEASFVATINPMLDLARVKVDQGLVSEIFNVIEQPLSSLLIFGICLA